MQDCCTQRRTIKKIYPINFEMHACWYIYIYIYGHVPKPPVFNLCKGYMQNRETLVYKGRTSGAPPQNECPNSIKYKGRTPWRTSSRNCVCSSLNCFSIMCVDLSYHFICKKRWRTPRRTTGAPLSQNNLADKEFWHVAIYIYIYNEHWTKLGKHRNN